MSNSPAKKARILYLLQVLLLLLQASHRLNLRKWLPLPICINVLFLKMGDLFKRLLVKMFLSHLILVIKQRLNGIGKFHCQKQRITISKINKVSKSCLLSLVKMIRKEIFRRLIILIQEMSLVAQTIIVFRRENKMRNMANHKMNNTNINKRIYSLKNV